MKSLFVGIACLFFCGISHAQLANEWQPCKPVKDGKCVSVIMHNDGNFWISEHHEDGTWTDVKKADCPNWHDMHHRRESRTDFEYGEYQCLYEMANPAPPPLAVNAGKGQKFWRYVTTHKEVLLGDAVVIAGQAVWASQATAYKHCSPGACASQAAALSGITVAGNHLWRYFLNEEGSDGTDQHVQWMWITPIAIVSGVQAYDYEHGSYTKNALQTPRLFHREFVQ